jgi:hypothetical protein
MATTVRATTTIRVSIRTREVLQESLLLDSGVLCSTMVRAAHLLIEGH